MKIYGAQSTCSTIFCVSENTYMLASSRNLCLRYISYTQSISRNFQKLQASLSLKERKYPFPCLCVEFLETTFLRLTNKISDFFFFPAKRKYISEYRGCYLFRTDKLFKINNAFLKLKEYLFKKRKM